MGGTAESGLWIRVSLSSTGARWYDTGPRERCQRKESRDDFLQYSHNLLNYLPFIGARHENLMPYKVSEAGAWPQSPLLAKLSGAIVL
jgi:hypothetical protein